MTTKFTSLFINKQILRKLHDLTSDQSNLDTFSTILNYLT